MSRLAIQPNHTVTSEKVSVEREVRELKIYVSWICLIPLNNLIALAMGVNNDRWGESGPRTISQEMRIGGDGAM